MLSVAAAVWLDPEDTVEQAEIWLGAVASLPTRVPTDDLLLGQQLTDETIDAVATAARRLATPMDNTDFQAQWRGVMAARYTEAALREIAGLDSRRLAPNHFLL